MKVPAIARLIKLRKNTPLTEQVTALGVCAKCHAHTLVEMEVNEEGRWLRCSRCRNVFVVPSRQGNG